MPGHHQNRLTSNGCHLYHDCFTCPFPDCIVDKIDPRVAKTHIRIMAAASLRDQGLSNLQIAQRLNCGPQAVTRYLKLSYDPPVLHFKAKRKETKANVAMRK